MSTGTEGVHPEVLALVRAALAEDIGDGDRTTRWTVDPDAKGSATILAKAEGVIAGTRPAGMTFREVGSDTVVEWLRADADEVAPGDVVARIRGRLAPILTAERTALNFLGRLSGVASLSARYARAVAGTGARVIDTRKTTPGWRRLEKEAVAAGGGANHRMGLYDMVLIKENHVASCGGIGPALAAVRDEAKGEGLQVEIEVRSLEELDEALAGGADRVLLDNMGLETLRQAVERVAARPGPRPLLEASGGVTLDSVRAIAETGVDLISVGAITHSAPALDLSLLVDAA